MAETALRPPSTSIHPISRQMAAFSRKIGPICVNWAAPLPFRAKSRPMPPLKGGSESTSRLEGSHAWPRSNDQEGGDQEVGQEGGDEEVGDQEVGDQEVDDQESTKRRHQEVGQEGCDQEGRHQRPPPRRLRPRRPPPRRPPPRRPPPRRPPPRRLPPRRPPPRRPWLERRPPARRPRSSGRWPPRCPAILARRSSPGRPQEEERSTSGSDVAPRQAQKKAEAAANAASEDRFRQLDRSWPQRRARGGQERLRLHQRTPGPGHLHEGRRDQEEASHEDGRGRARGRSEEGRLEDQDQAVKADLTKYKDLLILRRCEIMGTEMASRRRRCGPPEKPLNMPVHMADVGTDVFEQDFTLGMAATEREMVVQIDAAPPASRTAPTASARRLESRFRTRLNAKPWAKYTVEALAPPAGLPLD